MSRPMGPGLVPFERAVRDILMGARDAVLESIPGERVPWDELWADARDDVLWWCEMHNIDPKRTPVDAMIEADPVAGEWRIEQYGRRVRHVAGVGAVLDRVVVRRVARAPLPWPTRDESTWVR